MALSFCSNWGSLELDHHNLNLNADMMSSFESELGAGDLLNFDYNLGLNSVLPEYNESLYIDSYNTNSLPYFSAPSDTLTSFGHSLEMFSLDELHESYQYPKRQRSSCAGNYFYSDFTPGFYDGYVPNPGLVPESMSMPELLLPPFPVSAANYGLGSTPEIEKKPMKLGLSAQSIAARERRRKITEKTQELGKLIPGGNKLNTAEMFHAASNYIKFLQAQAALLQLMPSIQETKEPLHTKELEALLASPVIQEKLSSEEKCLVPKEFLQILANDNEVQLKPLIVKDIDHLLQTNG